MTIRRSDKVVREVEVRRVKPSELRLCLLAAFEANEIPMIWSNPGEGKTQIVGQAAAEWCGHEDNGASYGLDTDYFRKVILSQREPSDLLGLGVPNKATGKSQWFPFDDMLPVAEQGVLFWDELPQAPHIVQAPARQALTERRIGPHVIHDGIRMVAAGNPPNSKAGSVRLLSHVASSLVHLFLIPDVDDWIKIATKRKFHPAVIAYNRWKSQESGASTTLSDFDPDATTFPCPRTWEKTSNLLYALDKMKPSERDTILPAMVSGTIGEKHAPDFLAFLPLIGKLPDVRDIVANPTKVPVPRPEEVGILYALASHLASKMTEKNISPLLKYLSRLPIEFNIFSVRDARRVNPAVAGTKEYGDWCITNKEMILDEPIR